MGSPVQINSVSHWNITLAEAKAKNQPIFVDFFATWCGPCKIIAPIYEQLASQYPNAVFLKVNVDKQKPIAAKYEVTAMPTFLVIKESGVVDTMRGADRNGLTAMVSRHASGGGPSGASQPAGVEKAKSEGNAAFAAGKYAEAVDHYTRAIRLESSSAVLYGNRAFAYMKLIKSSDTPKSERLALRPKAVQDAEKATTLDERWAKGWIRMAEAMVLAGDEEGMESVPEGMRAVGRVSTLEGAQEAIENAIGLSDGNLRADAQKILDDIQSQLQALK